jgi:hypothetical protein
MAETPGTDAARRPGAPLTPAQLRTRERFESLIRLAAPTLDLLLAVGDRISRMAEPEDFEYYPVRSPEPDEPGADGPGAGRGEPSAE